MLVRKYSNQIDYLVIGHLSLDITESSTQIGGTVAYAALTAKAFGLKVGIVTSWHNQYLPDLFSGISIVNLPSERPTTYENIYTPNGRRQILHSLAATIHSNIIPENWLRAPIIHLAPIANEIDPAIVRVLSESFIGITPQGWLRDYDAAGNIHISDWPEARFVLGFASAVVISNEDVKDDLHKIEEFAAASKVLAVTEAEKGVVVYANGSYRRIGTTLIEEIDSTGAGDIFATAFFYRLFHTGNPWESAAFANAIASVSVTRRGLNGVPTVEEVQMALSEVKQIS